MPVCNLPPGHSLLQHLLGDWRMSFFGKTAAAPIRSRGWSYSQLRQAQFAVDAQTNGSLHASHVSRSHTLCLLYLAWRLSVAGTDACVATSSA